MVVALEAHQQMAMVDIGQLQGMALQMAAAMALLSLITVATMVAAMAPVDLITVVTMAVVTDLVDLIMDATTVADGMVIIEIDTTAIDVDISNKSLSIAAAEAIEQQGAKLVDSLKELFYKDNFQTLLARKDTLGDMTELAFGSTEDAEQTLQSQF